MTVKSKPGKRGLLLEQADTEIAELKTVVARLQRVISELADAADDQGCFTSTLELWALGQNDDGPTIAIGPKTPETCKMIAAYRSWKAEN